MVAHLMSHPASGRGQVNDINGAPISGRDGCCDATTSLELSGAPITTEHATPSLHYFPCSLFCAPHFFVPKATALHYD